MSLATVTSAVILTCATALACRGRDDTKGNIEKALDQANIPHVAVDVDKTANVVHLKGRVDNLSDRTRAGEVATAVVGTTGQVQNELTVKGLDSTPATSADSELEDVLDRLIDADPVLRERDVNFYVADGAVTALGEVRSAEEKRNVTRIVKAAPGVKDFTNDLEIRPEQ